MEEDSGAAMVANLMAEFRESSLFVNPAFCNPLPRSYRPEPPSSTRRSGPPAWLTTAPPPSSTPPTPIATSPISQPPSPCSRSSTLLTPCSPLSDAVFQRAACEARSEEAAAGPPPVGRHVADHNGVSFHELFQKELTPGDVGKLIRLVIPKKYAVKHFPQILTIDRDRGGGCREFKNLQGWAWEFRYCYWKSSQSFVFTKGWNRFVKMKQLHAKDTVTFYQCETGACTAERRRRCAIIAWGSWRCSCHRRLLSPLLQVTPGREGAAGLPPL
ncbi:hypothetical protein Taro_040631 [Colocasia esculenta]|uniref:TF-B3 domain-containing protein n=1 Tax=Colocasia esculenta TaxID=4460 RepID=A0A843WMG4_COLES|nr:hypothetical protein [Colocasia esculenta]